MQILRKVVHLFVVLFVLLTFVNCKKRDRNSRRVRLSGKCKPQVLAEYELTFIGGWSASLYPKMYPRYRPPAQWSKLIGRTHSDSYSMWSLGSYASPSVRQFAEDGDMTGFDKEAQSYGGIRDSFTAAPIRGGLGKSGTHFITDGRHTKVSFMVKIIPSPDWFVGISSFDLCQRKRWKKYVEVDLYPLDAGIDNGLAFSSPNWPSKPAEEIYKLSPSRPNHAASSFHYPDIQSLPPIARVKLMKVSEYRMKGKILPPADKENNLVILDENDDNTGEVSEIIRSVKKVLARQAKSRLNEIPDGEVNVPKADHTDCLVSEWGPWSECSKTCGFGRQERHRTIIQRASGRGQYCPVLREDKTCGTMKTCQWNSFQFLKRNG